MPDALLTADLEVPFWCSFRLPFAANVHSTYPIPPPTTLLGLVACAMGYPADSYHLLNDCKVGAGLVKRGQLEETLTQIIKWDRREKNPNLRALVIKQKLLRPIYSIFIKADARRLETIARSLEDPFWPLALGESDDLVVVSDIKVLPLKVVKTEILHNCAPVSEVSVREDVNYEIAFLPFRFVSSGNRQDWTGVDYKAYYVEQSILLKTPVNGYQVGEKVVFL